jgi:hypothetical protein
MNCIRCGKEVAKLAEGWGVCQDCADYLGKLAESVWVCPRCGKPGVKIRETDKICLECHDLEILLSHQDKERENNLAEEVKKAKKDFPTFAEKSIPKEVDDDDLPF